MNKKHFAILPLLIAVITMSLGACSDSSDYDYSTYNDCVVTSATLGTLKRIMHTEASDGSDSTYTVSLVGSYYPLYIDQLNNRIYNADSLPVGTDLTRVVFSTFSTTGVPGIRSLYTDEDSTFTYTDSTDCSVNRLITVYAYDGESSKTYTLSLAVHNEEADTFRWTQVLTDDATLKTLEGAQRLFRHADGTFLVYGTQGGSPVVLSATTPGNWTVTSLPAGIKPASVVANADISRFYALAGDDIATSDDGVNWSSVGAASVPDGILAVGSSTLAGVKDGAFCSSTDGGVTWNTDEADEPAYIPVTDFCGTVVASSTDPQMEYFVAAGLDANGDSVAWRRAMDLTGMYTFEWYYLPAVADYEHNYPHISEATMAVYDESSVVTGLKTDGTPDSLYVSRDNGRTWSAEIIDSPVVGKATNAHVSLATDSDNYIWVLESTTGSLWRGRYNRLGWDEEQTSFESTQKK